MPCKGMGINIQPGDAGRLDRLESKLRKACELGFDAVELPIHAMDLIKNGEVQIEKLKGYEKLLHGWPLRITAHAPFELNLFRRAGRDIDQKVLFASIEICRELGAELLVYHVGRYVGEPEFGYPQDWANYSAEEKNGLLLEEQTVMRQAGELAKQAGLRVGMENMRPYLDCPEYCYSVVPSALAEQVKAINHPNIGITLDAGHFFLACSMYGLELETELQAIVPYINHLHVHDNFGKASYSSEKNVSELTALGRGDLHMPIGEGSVPMNRIMKLIFPVFNGYYIHEIRERHEQEWHTLVERYRQTLPEPALMQDRMDGTFG